MCDIWKTREGKSFHSSDLAPHIASIRRLGTRWIVFSGGEPLLNPELPQLCSMLREDKIHLTLLTTGLLLEKRASDVANCFDDVIVSLDGPAGVHDAIRRVEGGFELLRSGIKSLRSLRPEIRITARSTVQKANHGFLRETVNAAKLLGLDAISFLAADLTSTAFNRPLAWPMERQEQIGLSISEVVELESEIETLICDQAEEFECGFIVETPVKMRQIARHFRVQLGLAEAQSPICNAPWVSAVVETDGTVRPCFFHRPLGNLREGSLETILNGEAARAFRANLDIAMDPICRRCVCSLNYRS
jgi:Fe-coproporphyrin III synthase